jgi:hypothetical protein
MAGKRQHILPRFLQRGFASNIVSKPNGRETVFTWYYLKGLEPCEITTENVGLEKHFYGKAGELSVDNDITDLEDMFAPVIRELRAKHGGYQISDSILADFVGHLSIRTKHVRDSFIDVAEIFTDTLFRFLANHQNFRWWMLEYHKRHPEVMRKMLDEQFKKMGVPRFQRRLALESLTSEKRLEFISAVIDRDQSEYESTFMTLRSELLQKIPSLTKDGHIKALAKSLIAAPRAEDYRALNWFVCNSPEPLILGDVGCLFEVAGPKQYMTITGKDDELKAVYLPISCDRLVVGTASPTAPPINFDEINRALAEHSRDYFICREDSQKGRELQKLLGTKAPVLTDDEIKEIFIDVLSES